MMLRRLWELARLFLKLGATSFGGPVAYIAIMERETVERRGWLSREQFLDLMGVTYLLPGPNAVEMANLIGYQRAGLLGCVVAGAAFTLPAVVISGLLAWTYLCFGRLEQVEATLRAVQPIVLGIIFAAVCRLGKAAIRSWHLAFIAAAVLIAALAGSDEVLALLVGSLLGAVFLRWFRPGGGADAPPPTTGAAAIAPLGLCSATSAPAVAAAAVVPTVAAGSVSLWQLALFFLKVGAVLYGSGYVLVAYIQGGLVNEYGLSQQELLDAVAVGQITPGPLISTVTFVGFVLCAKQAEGNYLAAGTAGAAVATLAVLLPSFVFVAVASPWIPRLRRSPWAGRFLDAVIAASIGLTAAVLLTLGQKTLLHWPAWVLAVGSAVVLMRWNIAPAWLVLAGAVAGRWFC